MTSSKDREAWLAARRDIVTASDVAAMLGESPWKTRDQLRMEKAGLADEFAGAENTDLALALEPWVIEQANARFGWRIEPCGVLIFCGGDLPLGATPDAVMSSPWGPCTVQIKVTSAQPTDLCKPLKSGKPSTAAFAEGPPLHMQLQVQAEMAVLVFRHSVLLVLHTNPLALRAYYVPAHDGVIARIKREAALFMAEVTALREGKVAV